MFTEDDARVVGESIGVDWDEQEFGPADLARGMYVELEHGTALGPEVNITDDDPEMTAKIAWAHLMESPAYYDLLDEMEQQFEESDRDRDAYMRTVDPSGKAPDRTISDSLRKYLNDYLGKLQAAVEAGKSADQAFKEIRPDMSRLSIDQLVSLLWENQQVGRRTLQKVPAFTDLYTVLENELARYVWELAVQEWGRAKTKPKVPKRQTDPETETVVEPKAAFIYQGHSYQELK